MLSLIFQNEPSFLVFFIGVIGVAVVLVLLLYFFQTPRRRAEAERDRLKQEAFEAMSSEEREAYVNEALATDKGKSKAEREMSYGYFAPGMICPHCQKKGQVRTKKVTQKKGISGSKATGAVLTGGISVLATGLSRKEDATKAHCDNCNSNWVF